MYGSGLLACLCLFWPGLAAAATADIPVAGQTVKLRAKSGNPASRVFTFRSDVDAAIAAPFDDPVSGASLFVFASNASGHCRAQIDLPAANWDAIGKDGPNKGWRYRDASASAGGVKKVLLRSSASGGRILVKAKGSDFPCDLEADGQAEPLQIVLRLADTRYCAAFGGNIKQNVRGSFKASDAAAPVECPRTDITAANLNVVHGLPCPGETEFCRLEDRIDLLGQWISFRGCPDMLAFQEVFDLASGSSANLMAERLTDVCPVPYHVIYTRTNTVDDSLLLSRYPTLSNETHSLHGPLRNALFARVDHPAGPVDIVSTHLASGADLATSPCETFFPCPEECIAAGAVTVRECQMVQLADIVEENHDVDLPALVMGDFNAVPGSFEYDHAIDQGWIDTTAAAGLAECDEITGTGCTSGREDDILIDLESPALNVDRRIDYIFLVPATTDSTCSGMLDSALDADGDGIATQLFAEEPNPFAPSCGAAPDPICWVSDHSGVQADVNCE